MMSDLPEVMDWTKTSRGKLQLQKRGEHVTVVEVEEKIVEWNLRYLYESNQYALEDLRTEVVKANLIYWLETPAALFDAICLDIDNGPAWTVTEENRSLYSTWGLMAVRNALTPAGAVSFWSASDCPWFVERLHEYFNTIKVFEVPVDRGEPDYVYVATNVS